MTASDRLPQGAFLAAALGLAALLAWDLLGWDLWVTRLYGDASGFAWRDAWLTRSLAHDGGRWLSALLVTALALQLRASATAPPLRDRVYWLTVICASLLLVPAFKRFSLTSCPWDLAEFGGAAAYVPHWLSGVADGGPGHCFPSGHAVAAFAFFGLYFLWRPHRPRLARAILAATLIVGTAFGWTQLARGAHFVSHTLWTAWMCWTTASVAAGIRRLTG